MQGADCFTDPWPTSSLIAHLHNPLMLARRGDDQLALMRIVAARFFHINVFAGCTGQNGGRGVPVIRRGYRNRVHLRILEESAQVFHAFRLSFLLLSSGRDPLGDCSTVHVTDVSNLGIGHGKIPGDVGHATPITADNSQADLFVCSFGRSRSGP